MKTNPESAANALRLIGSTAAIFNVVHAVLLAPLPYTAPDRLVHVWQHRAGA